MRHVTLVSVSALLLTFLACDVADLPGGDLEEHPMCGGIAGFQCEAGSTCVDDPNDGCDPERGADCGGSCYDCNDRALHREYVDRDPRACEAIDFDCKGDAEAFYDDCGCGCAEP
jgi:hypothetical protein